MTQDGRGGCVFGGGSGRLYQKPEKYDLFGHVGGGLWREENKKNGKEDINEVAIGGWGLDGGWKYRVD